MNIYHLTTQYGVAVIKAPNRGAAWELLREKDGEEQFLTFNLSPKELEEIQTDEPANVIVYFVR